MLITIGVAASLGIVALLLALSGARAGQNASRFFAAAGQFGLVLYAVLAIGDTYSIGTLLGFPGSIFADGGFAALWFCGYIMLAFPIATMLYPRLWRIGQECGAATLTDLFRYRFNDRRLDLLLAALLFLCFIPLGTSQFIGLQSAFKVVAGPDTARGGMMAALTLSGLLTFLIAAGQGMGGAARAAILKDVLVISTIVMVAGAALMAGARWLSPPHQGVIGPPEVFKAFTPSVSGDLFILTTIAVQASAFCISPRPWPRFSRPAKSRPCDGARYGCPFTCCSSRFLGSWRSTAITIMLPRHVPMISSLRRRRRFCPHG
ncbi:hypothetical protein CGLAMM_03120 [Acetobacteraceae bacterium EV16G]|uniref:sodium:solute symporter family transporter n=1 Tax=Sorlinia euscelidii TaxID=3081148 RepID=UPI002F3AEA39